VKAILIQLAGYWLASTAPAEGADLKLRFSKKAGKWDEGLHLDIRENYPAITALIAHRQLAKAEKSMAQKWPGAS
jgi:hypothetical protein